MHVIVNKDSVANVNSAEVNKSFSILFYYMHAKSLQLCLTFWTLRVYDTWLLFPWILQARILAWVAISSSRELLDPGIEPVSPALQADS